MISNISRFLFFPHNGTVTMHLYRRNFLPSHFLETNPQHFVQEKKFLDVVFVSKYYISYFAGSVLEFTGPLFVVKNYGCEPCSSAKITVLKTLGSVHSGALGIFTGALRSSTVQSPYTENGEKTLSFCCDCTRLQRIPQSSFLWGHFQPLS